MLIFRKKQHEWIEKMKREHLCFKRMMKALNSEQSQGMYAYKIQKFMKYQLKHNHVKHIEDFESLLKFDSEKITDILEQYVYDLEDEGLISDSVKSTIAAPELFFEMNRKLWHKKLVRRSIEKTDRVQAGQEPATDEDIQIMLSYCERSLRKQAIIHFLASTGIRPAALVDPIIRLKHLTPMPNPNSPIIEPEWCYAVKIYDESNENYWSFLTPEAKLIIDRYLNGRKLSGEILTDESPLFTTLNSRHHTKNTHLSDTNLKNTLHNIIVGSKIPRKHVGNRFDKAIIYMFRKRFNGKLKMDNDVNSNIAEKLMAHKRGLDGVYLKPTRDECYREFVKAIPQLTIDPTERQKIEIETKQQKIDELESKTTTIDEQAKQIKELQIQQEDQARLLRLIEKYPRMQD